MIFSYHWLQSFFKEKLPSPQKLAELLTMHSFEVSEVKKEDKDWALNIDVLPNRGPDCFSHLGIARECAAILNLKLKTQALNSQFKTQKLKTKDFIRVEVKDKAACPRYIARAIADVKVGPSPKLLKERLKVCGLQSINNIVDIANYVMLETGQPLHAFDGEKLEGQKIIVRFAKEGEKIITLDNQKFDLGPSILAIADAKKPVAIAGIKGGKEPEINKKTKIVVLESANFDPRTIRKGSRMLNLKTDASRRFEHGLDPNLAEFAINRAASLIQQFAGGKIAKGLIDVYWKKYWAVGGWRSKKIRLDLDYVEGLLGVKIPDKEIIDILKRLGFQCIDVGRRYIEVQAPSWRLDVFLPEDLIEEIGRIYGYEKIPAVLPTASLIPPKRNLELFWENQIKDILKEVGFSETYNYSFVGEKEPEIFGWKAQELIEVANPISVEQKYLRPSLIPGLVKNVKENSKYFDEVSLFELGKIFYKPFLFQDKVKKKPAALEKKMLAGILAKKKPEADLFYGIKGKIDFLLRKLGISKIWYDFYQPTPEESKISIWHPRKCAEIKIDGEEIGFLGELSPKLTEATKIKDKVVIFDIDFEKLIKFASEEHEYWPISKYPAAVRDLAVLVPQGVLVAEVLNKINAAGGPLIRDIDLFDVYGGEEIPPEKKSLAFHIIYQAEDRTLSSKEIDEIQNKIIKALEEDPEWEVRK